MIELLVPAYLALVPEVPLDPDAPLAPEDPLEPVAPEEPDAPVAPDEPDAPVAPLDPEAPVAPEEPLEPLLPLDPEVEVYATAATPTFLISTMIEGAAGLNGEDRAPSATSLIPALLAENAISI